MALLMGIDIGSTSIKAVVYDETGSMVSEASNPTVLSHPDNDHPGWSVWEPKVIWEAVCRSVSSALSKLDNKNEVKGVAVTGFGMDGLPIGKNGEFLYPLISWHCPRTTEIAQRFSQQVGQKKIFDISGGQFMTIHSIYRMIWMRENHPEILEKTHKWLLVEDFVNYMLCGEMATDYSMGWNTTVLDQKEGKWSDELISLADIPKSIFPVIRQSGTVLGNVSEEASQCTGLSRDTKVVLGGHDYICAALAVGAIDKNVVMDVTGTWEMVLQASDDLSHDERIFNSGYYVENHVARDRFCFVASTVSGDMTEWLKNTLSFEELQIEKEKGIGVWETLMNKAKRALPGSNGCFFLPHFSGAGMPIMDANSLGAFVGLSNSVTKGEIIRSIIEGLDYQFYQMVEALEQALSISPNKIIAVGGATKNEFWMQNKADVCGKLIETPDVYEATPLGAAMLAGIGLGIYKDEIDAISAVYRKGAVYEPDTGKNKLYQHLYHDIFKNIYGALKGVNNAIFHEFK